MPTFLGKNYTTEIVFQDKFNSDLVTILSDKMEDVTAVSEATVKCFNTMKRLKSKQMKTLIDLTIGPILITAKTI